MLCQKIAKIDKDRRRKYTEKKGIAYYFWFGIFLFMNN